MSEKRYALHTVIGNLLFPPRCCFCGALTGWEEALCTACRESVQSACATHMERGSLGCEAVVWCGEYRDVLRTGMERFKFDGVRRGQALFGELLLFALRESGVLSAVEGVTYVPMQRERQRRRGYNQARLLAEYIAKACALPLRENLLRRSGRGTAHGTSGRRARVALVQGSYHAGKEQPKKGERLLLVDDIITTGTTLATCAEILLANGAGAIYGAAPLRTPAAAKSEPAAQG